MTRRALSLAVWSVALFSAAALRAHNAPGSAVLLDFHSQRVDAELRLPVSELKYAFRHDWETEPALVVSRFHDQLADYVRQHIVVRTPDGRPWTMEVRDMEIALQEQPIDLVVRTTWQPPSRASARQFTLVYDVISHEVMNHIILVSVRSDWDAARLGGEPELLGTLRSFAKELVVNRVANGGSRAFRSVFELGMHHIGEGTDHLLFLLVLLLPAPLVAAGRRWGGYAGLRRSAVSLAKIVTAFTAGHSLTLLLGAFGWVQLSVQLVEVLIATSILVSAVHAWRPIFPGREPFIAATFGLVHGMAFATVLSGFRLDAWHLGQALLAFNLGIEAMQLIVVLITVPWLVLLSRVRLYALFRVGGALLGAMAAVGWIGERGFGSANPLNDVIAFFASHALGLVSLLAFVALLTTAWNRRPNDHAAKLGRSAG